MLEMLVKRENGINAVVVYQGKAGAVRKAQPLVVKTPEDCLCGIFDIFGYAQNDKVAFSHLIHELDGRVVTAPDLKERVNLVEDIIGGVKAGLGVFKPLVDGFCFSIVLVFGDGEGTEGAGVYKDLQSAAPP